MYIVVTTQKTTGLFSSQWLFYDLTVRMLPTLYQFLISYLLNVVLWGRSLLILIVTWLLIHITQTLLCSLYPIQCISPTHTYSRLIPSIQTNAQFLPLFTSCCPPSLCTLQQHDYLVDGEGLIPPLDIHSRTPNEEAAALGDCPTSSFKYRNNFWELIP